ncbi:MAG: ThuA domain-containing protein [Phycisphaeraceae bacterium]|nr:ThuA domain-containing protein [Phycisphaeraceae bacterium]
MPRHFTLLLVLSAMLFACTGIQAEDHGDKAIDKVKVAIFTGQNNHGWMMDTPVLEDILDDHKIFDTTVLQTPDRKDPDKAAKWQAFKPDFTKFDVIVLNYNGEMWPDHIKKGWVDYVAGGGKVYSFHAGNNPFKGWAEFEQMIGLLWRGNKDGKRVYFDDEGNKVVQDEGEGPGAGHGSQHAYVVDTKDNEHPVFKGLPDQWMHAKDELYHGQRGPALNMTVLLTAYAEPKTRGTGVHEPIVWTIPYGDGLIMTNVMGHWWKNQKDGPALACAGFQTIFTRSIEWLATGKVTIEKPDDFPTKDAVSVRELKPFEPLAYIHVPGVPGSDPMASCDCSPQTQPGFVPAWVQFADMLKPLPGESTAEQR